MWRRHLQPGPLPFNFEGIPKQHVAIIKRGISTNVVYDTQTAAKEPGKHSTGHALPAPNPGGPAPLNLFVQPGATPMAELGQNIKRGVYVTRFFYVNTVHPRLSLLTGLTLMAHF